MRSLAVALCAAALILSLPLAGSAVAEADGLVTYRAPAGQPLNSDFAVKVRQAGGTWQDLDEHRVTVDLDTQSPATMVAFDSRGPVEISITKTSGTIRSARVRPLSYGITPVISSDGKTATFTLPRPLKVSFEANGDTLHNVHVFANPIDAGAPSARGRKLIFFGPGIHVLPGDHLLDVPNKTTVYIAGGAVVRGGLVIDGARDVIVRGHGILDASTVFAPVKEETVQITNSSDVAIRDITILDSQDLGFDILNSNRIVLANVKEINAAQWTDGIDVQASSNVLVDDVFLRTSDDSVAIYASTPFGAHGSSSNVAVRNSTLWADVAHPILIGTHGNPDGADVVKQVAFQNIDILEHDEEIPRYQGAMAVNAGDSVAVQDIRFENIRVEDFTQGQLVNVRVFLNPSYNKQPGRAVDRVLFRNVTYNGSGDRESHVEGYDDSRRVTNVVFENLRRNGELVRDGASGNIAVGPYVSAITFREKQPTTARNDGALGVRYVGRWSHQTAKGFFDGDEHLTRTAGSRALFTFSGRQARLYGATGPTNGRADVFVDGKYRTTIDTYSFTRRTQQIWFDTGGLAAGVHKIEVRAKGDRNRLSAGTVLQLDKLEFVSGR